EEIRLVERLLYDNSSPRPPEEFNSENFDATIESFSPSPIPVEDSDPLMEEIDLFLASDGSIPPGIDNDYSNSKGDNLFLERLLHDDHIPLSYTLDFSNVVRVFLPFFTYLVTSSILLSSGSEDTIIDPVISNYHFSSLEPGAHIGYNCPPKVPVISNPKPCKSQTIDELPQTLPSFHPTFYSGDESPFTCDLTPNIVDDFPNVFNLPPQPPKYSYEFCGNDAYYGYACPPQVPFTYDLEPILATILILLVLTNFYHQQLSVIDHTPLEESMKTLRIAFQAWSEKIQRKKEEKEKQIEPDNSLNMGDEHLDTISATKSDEFIKSSVENLVSNPSESEGEHECDVPACDDFTTFFNLLFDADYDFFSSDDESFSDEDISKKIYSNPLFDKEIISIKIDPHQFNAESDLIESLLNQDSSIISSSLKIDYLLDEFAEFNSENSDAIIESFSPSPIPVEDNDPFLEEIDLFLAFDGSIPPDVLGDNEFCQRCTCMRCGSGLSKGLCLICKNNQNSLNDSPIIYENTSQSPPHINYHCCYECGDPLDGIFCKRCTYESPFTCDSTPNIVDDSPNVFNPPPQLLKHSYEFYGNDAYYGYDCPPQQKKEEEEKQVAEEQAAKAGYCKIPICYDDDEDYTIAITPKELGSSLSMGDEHVDTIPQKKEEEEKQVAEEQAAKARYCKIPICYDDDEDYTIAITPKEPDNSLSMGDEHVDTILVTESNEFIKSSVENLVSNPSEPKGEHECDVSACDDFTTFFNLLFDVDDDFSSKILLIEKLLYDNSSPRLPEEFNFENSDAAIKSFSPSPIPVEDTGPLIEEIDLFLASDGSILP
nr:hypothetical protein [Tanacetum cinerariifolium]